MKEYNNGRYGECDVDQLGTTIKFVGKSLMSMTHILNRVPFDKDNIIPFEFWKKHKTTLNYFKVWGCLAYIRLPNIKTQKLGLKTVRCAFVGYS